MFDTITKPVIIRDIPIGKGTPKICVPIVADTIGSASAQAAKIASCVLEVPETSSVQKAIDMVEWRADCMPSVTEAGIGLLAARSIRAVLPDLPIIYTFRTKKEGGHQAVSKETYLDLAYQMVQSGYIDLIDLELSVGDSLLKKAISFAHQNGVKVIMSNHEFHGTPSVQEMVSRLTLMEALGADILKIAVMPQEPKDTLKLLSASLEMYKRTPCPIIAIAMSNMGAVTRMCGGFFGSAVTFASLEKSSAPGQIEALQMRQVLNMLDFS